LAYSFRGFPQGAKIEVVDSSFSPRQVHCSHAASAAEQFGINRISEALDRLIKLGGIFSSMQFTLSDLVNLEKKSTPRVEFWVEWLLRALERLRRV
jgi:hypothetical protein